MEYDNTNRGVLFKNDRKEKDTHPDYTGTLNVAGVEHYFSAWIKDGKKGKFMSLSIGKPKEPKPQDQHNQAKSNGYQDDGFEDLPF